jgi:hypothetical protein
MHTEVLIVGAGPTGLTLGQEEEHALFFAGDPSYTQQLLLEHAVDGVTRDVALYQQTSQQIRMYLQSVPTIYLPSHDPGSVHRLATRTAARLGIA